MTLSFSSCAGWMAVLAVAIGLSSSVERVDSLTRPASPWVSKYPCPIALPEFNPLALQRSAIGRSLSIALIDQSNRAFHLGLGKARRVKAVSRLGRFMEYLDYTAHWRPHFHATRQAARQAAGVDRLILTAASDKTEQAVLWAYYLDPTNYDAYELVAYTLADDQSALARHSVEMTDADGTRRQVATGDARALLFSYYAFAQYPTTTPRGCLARASTLINIWLLNQEGRLHYRDRKQFWNSTALTMTKVSFWMQRSEALRQEELRTGRWQRQSGMELADYEAHLSLTYAIWQQTLLRYQKWQQGAGA